MTPNKRVAQEFLDAYTQMDFAAIEACLADDVEWLLPGAFHLTGKGAVLRSIKDDALDGGPAIRVARMFEEADVVVVEGAVETVHRDCGPSKAMFCDVFEMDRGQIRRLTTYLMTLKE